MAAKLPASGERDKPVTIEVGTEGVDASGAPTMAWPEASRLPYTVWMWKDDISGRERLFEGLVNVNAQQIQSSYDSRWVMPYQCEMDPEVIDVPKFRRLVYRGRTHDIVHARLTDDGDGIELYTAARTSTV